MTIFTSGPVERSSSLLSEYAINTGEAISAYESEALRFGPFLSAGRLINQAIKQNDEESPVLTVPQQKERIAAAEVPLKPEEGLRQSTLDLLIERKQSELADRSAIARASGWQSAGGFASGLVVSIFDPLNIATAYIPIAGPARYAAQLATQTTRAGRAGVRASFGAGQGLVGAAAIEPLVAYQAANEQADYTMMDTLMNLTLGTALGGGLHMGIGAAGDAIAKSRQIRATGEAAKAAEELTPDQRTELIRTSIASAIEDRHPIVSPDMFLRRELMGSTALARVDAPKDIEVNITPETITVNGAAVPQDIQLHARQENPELFKRYDGIASEINGRRSQLDEQNAGKTRGAELVEVDKELQTMLDRQGSLSKRQAKKLQVRIDELKAMRSELEGEARSTDTPDMAKLRARVAVLDTQMLDMAVEVSDAVTKSTDTLHKTGVQREQTTFRTEQTTSPDFHNPFPDLVKQHRSPAGVRLTNFAALDENTKLFGGFDDRMDTNAAKAETAEILNDIRAFSEQIDDPELTVQLNKLVETETENVTLAEAYNDGLSAAFICRTR